MKFQLYSVQNPYEKPLGFSDKTILMFADIPFENSRKTASAHLE
jgi:hypothetical protein